jgi:leader peptidase (prepilin peptidase)/N-methyltransferase
VTAFLVVTAGIAGLLVGSFLNVVIARVPEGRSVVTPRSACPDCGKPIGAAENIPVVSWLLLRGRAACCGTRISVRYPLVELATGAAFAALAAWQGLSWLLPALLYLAAVSIALTVIDLQHFRLPFRIVKPAYPVAAVLLTAGVLGEAGWWPLEQGDWWPLARAAICGAAMWLFYAVLWVVHPKGMGFGDVVLAGVLGMYLGVSGWGEAFVGTFSASFVGGAVSLWLLFTGRANRKTAIPYGPYMIIGCWIGLIAGGAITDWYLDFSGYA